MHGYVYTCMCACIHSSIHPYMHTYIHTYMYTYLPTCSHTYVHIHIHKKYTYTHTYIHTDSNYEYIYTFIHTHRTTKDNVNKAFLCRHSKIIYLKPNGCFGEVRQQSETQIRTPLERISSRWTIFFL